MRSFLYGLGLACLLIAGAVAVRLIATHAHSGIVACPARPLPGPLPGHPGPVPLTGSYFHTGTVADGKQWGDGFPSDVSLDPGALRRGASLYARDCRTCHGALGLGDGIMTRLPEGPRGVADLQAPDAVRRPDGEIFAIVTRGKGKMIGYGDTIPEADRWAIVAYLRALQASQHATPAEWAEASGASSLPPVPETGLGAPTPAEAARLSSSGWIDQKAGTVHVPIERALGTTLDRLRAKQAAGPLPAGPATPLP